MGKDFMSEWISLNACIVQCSEEGKLLLGSLPMGQLEQMESMLGISTSVKFHICLQA